MNTNTNDCHTIEARLEDHRLYMSTTQDQLQKLNQQDPDVQNKRDALTRKLDSLQKQIDMLQRALEDCQQGKATNLPPFEVNLESDGM